MKLSNSSGKIDSSSYTTHFRHSAKTIVVLWCSGLALWTLNPATRVRLSAGPHQLLLMRRFSMTNILLFNRTQAVITTWPVGLVV
jgi:hypothetical protein